MKKSIAAMLFASILIVALPDANANADDGLVSVTADVHHNDVGAQRSSLTLPMLVDKLLTLSPVIPTDLNAVSRVTGVQFKSYVAGPQRDSDSGEVLLADGSHVTNVELRAYPTPDSPVELITITVGTTPCIDPKHFASRYKLTHPFMNPPPAPPAAGYPPPAGPIPFRDALYRRETWGLFVIGFDGYQAGEKIPSCVNSITLRKIDERESAIWHS